MDAGRLTKSKKEQMTEMLAILAGNSEAQSGPREVWSWIIYMTVYHGALSFVTNSVLYERVG